MRVLLIDDDADVLSVTSRCLQRLGHAVVAFCDPRKALTALRSGETDLVISDIMMPFVDGFRVALYVAETLGTAPPRLLLISGSPDAAWRAREFPPSVVIGVLPKPFSYTGLRQVLALLEQARSRCPGTLAGFCSYAGTGGKQCLSDEIPARAGACVSTRYAECQHYDRHCGLALRQWISTLGASASTCL